MKKAVICLLVCMALSFGTALAEGIYYNPDGGHYYHADQNCATVSSKYLPLQPGDADIAATFGLEPCMLCVSDPLPVDDRDDTPWFDPDGGAHYHIGRCPATASGAWDRQWMPTAGGEGQYTVMRSGCDQILMPCSVCHSGGFMADYYVLRLGSDEPVLHNSPYCPGIPAYYRSSGDLAAVSAGMVPIEEGYLYSDALTDGSYPGILPCSYCLGYDQVSIYAWYNVDGGALLHKDPKCRTISPIYHDYMRGVVWEQMEGMHSQGYTECSACMP